MKTTRIRVTFVLVAAATLTTLSAVAETTAASLVDCWANALGGRERLAAIRAVEREGVVETGGMKGSVHAWSTAAGELRTDVELGPYRSTDAFDGKRGWTKTGSAPAHELTDADLSRIVSDAYLESMSPFFADRMKGSTTLVEATDGPRLVIEPVGGLPVTVRLDAESCRPVSIEQPERDRTLRVELLEWTEVDGVRFPKKLRQSTGDLAYDVVVTYQSTQINPAIDDGRFNEDAGAGTGISWNGRASASTSLELTQNHPYVPVFVNGKGPSMFILDTGADLTVIEKGHAAEIGLAMEGSIEIRGGGEGTLDASMIAGPTVKLAGLEIPSEAMIAIPLGPLSLYEGRPMQGILGYDVLSRFVVEVDYAGRQVTFHDPAKFATPKGAHPFEVYFDGNTPVMKGKIGLPDGRSFDARLTVDTGNRTALILHQPFVEAHQLRKALPVLANAPLGMGVGGMTRQDLGRVASLALGEFVMKEPLTSFSIEKSGANANPDIDGNLGSEVLRRFTLWIDYGSKRILLRPNRHLAEPFEYDMSGLTLAQRDASGKELAVLHVLPGSPAQDAGVLKGDVIVGVDGAAPPELEAVRAKLGQPGGEVRLGLRRAGGEVVVTVKMRRLI
ncbi:MAG: aspartyl protease family protein [Thermoanaerobaculia bacterium]|nr:aspartyl protease family protein [Thermoanaerobaculia bacterium]